MTKRISVFVIALLLCVGLSTAFSTIDAHAANSGFVSSRYIKLDNPYDRGTYLSARVVLQNDADYSYLNVRDDYSMSANVIAKLHNNAHVTVMFEPGRHPGWYHILY